MVREACPLPDCDSEWSILFHLPDRGDRILVCAKLGCPGQAHKGMIGDRELLELFSTEKEPELVAHEGRVQD